MSICSTFIHSSTLINLTNELECTLVTSLTPPSLQYPIILYNNCSPNEESFLLLIFVRESLQKDNLDDLTNPYINDKYVFIQLKECSKKPNKQVLNPGDVYELKDLFRTFKTWERRKQNAPKNSHLKNRMIIKSREIGVHLSTKDYFDRKGLRNRINEMIDFVYMESGSLKHPRNSLVETSPNASDAPIDPTNLNNSDVTIDSQSSTNPSDNPPPNRSPRQQQTPLQRSPQQQQHKTPLQPVYRALHQARTPLDNQRPENKQAILILNEVVLSKLTDNMTMFIREAAGSVGFSMLNCFIRLPEKCVTNTEIKEKYYPCLTAVVFSSINTADTWLIRFSKQKMNILDLIRWRDKNLPLLDITSRLVGLLMRQSKLDYPYQKPETRFMLAERLNKLNRCLFELYHLCLEQVKKGVPHN
jgi:hypothetical protein